eukprot:4829841-Amphidinium_carterae.3
MLNGHGLPPLLVAVAVGLSNISGNQLTGLDGYLSPTAVVAVSNSNFFSWTEADSRVKWDSARFVLGGVWHEARTHSAFVVGDLCVRCREEVEDLAHIVFVAALA